MRKRKEQEKETKQSALNKTKQAAKVAATKVKSASKTAATKVKSASKTAVKAVKTYTGKMKQAYEDGYVAGYEEAQKLPNVRGAIAVATSGFSNGAKARRKSEKAKEKVTRIKARTN